MWWSVQNFQVDGRLLARPAVGLDVVRDLLTLAQTSEAGALNRADVHKNIFAADVRPNEAVTDKQSLRSSICKKQRVYRARSLQCAEREC